jgi:electron transport complex protein RnfG
VLDIIKMIFALTIISAVAGLAIGVANGKTAEKIAEQQRQARLSAIEAVFPKGSEINEMKDSGGVLPEKYWTAFSEDGTLFAYAFEMSGRGYAGDVKFMVGVALDGKILGITVLDHNETPGLGSRVGEIPSSKYIWYPVGGAGESKAWFTEQFEGLSSLKPISIDKQAGEWHKLDENARAALKSKHAVTAITGSTITTAAFTRAIEQKVSIYLKELGGYCCPATKLRKEAEAQAEAETEAAASADNNYARKNK